MNSFIIQDGASVVICKSLQESSNNVVEHYYNNGHRSSLLDENNPTTGISNANIRIIENNLVCTFRRENSKETPGYFDLKNRKPYVQVAYGYIKGSSNIIL